MFGGGGVRVLVAQPRQEQSVIQLRDALKQFEVDLAVFPEDYLRNADALESACRLARKSGVVIATGAFYGNGGESPIRRAIVIDHTGAIVMNRPKTPKAQRLLPPHVVSTGVGKLGMLLCREIFLDPLPVRGADIIVNPIGVGMYSDAQFKDWTERARAVARLLRAPVVGASHSDGSFRPGGVSIPIAFAIDAVGLRVMVLRDDAQHATVVFPTNEYSRQARSN